MSMRLRLDGLLMACILLSACGEQKETESADEEEKPFLRFDDLRSPGSVGDCQYQVVEQVIKENGEIKNSPPEEDVTVTASLSGADVDLVKLYDDEECKHESTSFVLEAAHMGAIIYYSFSATGTAILEAASTGYDPIDSISIGAIDTNESGGS